MSSEISHGGRSEEHDDFVADVDDVDVCLVAFLLFSLQVFFVDTERLQYNHTVYV